MEFRLLNDNPLRARADLLAVTVLGDPGRDPVFRSIDEALGGDLREAARTESFEGKSGQSLILWTSGRLPAKRVMVIGLGNKNDVSPGSIRDGAAAAGQAGNRVGAETVTFLVPALGNRGADAAQVAVEGVVEGMYKFSRYQTGDDAKKPPAVKTVALAFDAKKKPTPGQARQLEESMRRGQVIAEAVCRARDLVNEPAGTLTPTQLAAAAEEIAARHKSVSIKVLGPEECRELGMGMFLAVAQGSDQEPRFVHMTYRPPGAKGKAGKVAKGKGKPAKGPRKIALIGKGLTFDSGGYSLKPSQAMEDMKIDMAGAAAVIAAMDAIATLGTDAEVHVVSAMCENLVSGRAFKLGDVLKSMDGTTVEINNTDAEGRLTLGDAITYVRTQVEPDEMFDFATLTGACMVALGPYTAGVMSDSDRLCNQWLGAAQRAGEDMWRLPLLPRLREQLKSPIADLRNTGDRYGGAITAGLFLKTFAKDTPWVHVDLAGPASASNGSRASVPRGGTGFGVATIVEYVCGR